MTRRAFDLLPALALLALGEAEVVLGDPQAPKWAVALLTAVLTLPLAARRRAPVVALLCAIGATAGLARIDHSFSQAAIPLSVLLASFSAGRYSDSWIGLAVVLAVGAALVGTDADLNELAIGAAMYCGVYGFGRALRLRAHRVEALSERTAQLERERETAVADERARIARELHDIVSHSISVVVVQAQAVRRRLGPEQHQEIDDLRGVEATARQAMQEMRRLFGVLRSGGGPLDLEPQPGLSQLDRLLAQARAAGLDVDAREDGPATPLPPGVDLAAYRIVQEALTNVRSHAGAHARATLTLRYGDSDLEILVEDDGAGPPRANGRPPGHGLIGMRERVQLYGGEFEAGPGSRGGFRVRARLPVREGA